MSIKQEIEFIKMLFWLHLDFFNPAFYSMSKTHLCNWWESFIVEIALFADLVHLICAWLLSLLKKYGHVSVIDWAMSEWVWSGTIA